MCTSCFAQNHGILDMISEGVVRPVRCLCNVVYGKYMGKGVSCSEVCSVPHFI